MISRYLFSFCTSSNHVNFFAIHSLFYFQSMSSVFAFYFHMMFFLTDEEKAYLFFRVQEECKLLTYNNLTLGKHTFKHKYNSL